MEWNQIKMNKKYADWILDSRDNIFNLLEGGVRSGRQNYLYDTCFLPRIRTTYFR